MLSDSAAEKNLSCLYDFFVLFLYNETYFPSTTLNFGDLLHSMDIKATNS